MLNACGAFGNTVYELAVTGFVNNFWALLGLSKKAVHRLAY